MMQDYPNSQLLIDTGRHRRLSARETEHKQAASSMPQTPRPGILRRVLRAFGATLSQWSDSMHDLQMSSPAAASARSHRSKHRHDV